MTVVDKNEYDRELREEAKYWDDFFKTQCAICEEDLYIQNNVYGICPECRRRIKAMIYPN